MASVFEIVDAYGALIRKFTLWMRCWYVDANDPARCDPIVTQVAFCKACDDFVHAEQILSAAECERIIEVERRLDEEGGESLRLREMLYGSRQQFAQYLRMEVLRMPERVSPPRCLTCGSVDISVEVKDRFFETGRMALPRFPDGLQVRWTAFADSGLQVEEANRYYDREGNRIQRVL